MSWEEAVRWLRDQPDRQALVRDGYYDDPLAGAADRYWRSEEWGSVRTYLSDTRGCALDVGAGRGIASYALAREGYADVVALEPDPSALVGAGAIRQLAQACAVPIRVTQDYSERLPFDDASFDLVFARAALHHSRNLMAACREFHRVLKPGGRLVAIREHVITRQDDLPAFLASHPLHGLYGGENAFQLDQYVAAIGDAGFSELRTLAPFDTPINYAPYSLSGLQTALAQRLCRRVPASVAWVRALLPRLWWLARPLLNVIDQRPGRLYSFIAQRE